jgi:hypothetical protein
MLMRFHQFAKGFGVAFFDSLHPNEILLRGVGRGIGLGGLVVIHEMERALLPKRVKMRGAMQDQPVEWQRLWQKR